MLVLAMATATLAGCAFDRSGLADKGECLSDRDCPGDLICESSRCVNALDSDRDADGYSNLSDSGDLGPVGPADATADAHDRDGSPCPGSENACRGCRALGHVVGSQCGDAACGFGTWQCATPDAVECRGESDGPNACGGCGPLLVSPGTPCGQCGIHICADDGESTICVADEPNACGGCAILPGAPGDTCGTCNDGTLECSGDGESLACVGASAGNPCGGCRTLPAQPGEACEGACGSGHWVCQTPEALVCQTESSNANACGGCTALEHPPGELCGVCGVYWCAADGEMTVCVDPGLNACGGCTALPALPNTACGPCNDGLWVCNGLDALSCRDASPLNACGGCGTLVAEPNTSCGVCGDGTWTCTAGGETVQCLGATPPNGCGGCDELEGQPNTACGACLDGVWTCGADGQVHCEGASAGNACGGCETLSDEPDTPCGPCSDGTWTCSADRNSVFCDGASERNVCEGCGELPGEPGLICSCDGLGEAVWACRGTELICADNNELPETSEYLGAIVEDDSVTTTGLVDGVDDVDWYRVDVIDEVAGYFYNPRAILTGTEGAGTAINYVLCLFLEYSDTPDITNYSCGSGDRCVFYDASEAAVVSGSCSGSPAFDASEDLYGCCENVYLTDVSASWRVRMGDVDVRGNHSGTARVMVMTDLNNREMGCDSYSLRIDFPD